MFKHFLARSALLWDLESGSVASRITSPKPFTAIRLLVQSKTIYVLAALWRDPVITVYNLGTIHRPVPGAKVVKQIHGHSTNILQVRRVKTYTRKIPECIPHMLQSEGRYEL